jgi:hypothetical protein
MMTIFSACVQLLVIGLAVLMVAVTIPTVFGGMVAVAASCVPVWTFAPSYTQRRRILSLGVGLLAFVLLVGLYAWFAGNAAYWVFANDHNTYPGMPGDQQARIENSLDGLTLIDFRHNAGAVKVELSRQAVLPPGVDVCFSDQGAICHMADRVSKHVALGPITWGLYACMLVGGAAAGLTTYRLLQENLLYGQRVSAGGLSTVSQAS